MAERRAGLMFRRITLLLFNLLCLSQLINALPQQPNEVSSAIDGSKDQRNLTTELIKSPASVEHDRDASGGNIIVNNKYNNNDDGSERDKLLYYTLEQFALLSNFTVEHGTEVLRNVLKEADSLEEPTDTLKSYLRDFSDFVARIEYLEQLSDYEKVGELYDMAVLFTEIVEQHNTTALQKATTENLYLEMLLKKNGLDKLQVDFLERFLIFTDKLKIRLDRYLEKLTAEQRMGEREMIEWYRMFNDEADVEKKVEIFTKFFELYA